MNILQAQLPDETEQMLYEMETILPEPIERLLQASADISGNQDFGLIMNELVDLSMYGLFGYILLNCSTVEDLFNTLVRYHSVHHDAGISYKISIKAETVSIQLYYDVAGHNQFRQTTDWGLGFIPLFLKPILGDKSIPLRSEFSYQAPINKKKLHDYFGSKLNFNCTKNQLTYPRSILDKRLNKSDSPLLKVLRDQADKQLIACQKESELHVNVKAVLLQNIESENSTAQDVADTLALSLSSLKRKLTEEGLSFKVIKEGVINNLAKQLLLETQASLNEIATKTGFKNLSSFTRFFIRHNQQNPSAFRKKQLKKHLKI